MPNEVEIEYKSFLLMPDAKYVPGQDYTQTLSNMKGMPLDQVKIMTSTSDGNGK